MKPIYQLLLAGKLSIAALIVIEWLVEHGGMTWIEKILDRCWGGRGGANKFFEQLRGSNYFLGGDIKYKKYCILTSWSLLHVVLYFLFGWFFPSMFWETLLMGIMFELVEWLTYDCHDLLDIGWNTLGFVMGSSLKSVF